MSKQKQQNKRWKQPSKTYKAIPWIRIIRISIVLLGIALATYFWLQQLSSATDLFPIYPNIPR